LSPEEKCPENEFFQGDISQSLFSPESVFLGELGPGKGFPGGSSQERVPRSPNLPGHLS